MTHHGVFTEVHLAVHHGIGVVLHIGVSRDHILLILPIICGKLHWRVGAANMGHSFLQLVSKVSTLDGIHRQVILAVLGTFHGQLTQNHLRMIYEVAVHGEAVLGGVQMHPIRGNIGRMIPLLQEQDIGNNLGSGILFEGIIGQTDSTQQIGSLGNILSCIRVPGIHGIAAGHKSNHTTGTHLIQGFCKKVVVDGESQLVIGLVRNLVVAEGNVAHCQIIEIPAVSCLEASDCDICLWIKLLGNTTGDGIQFHAVQAAVPHGFRQ